MKFPSIADIRVIRKALGVTQSELARESGVSQGTIAKIEGGKMSARYDTVVDIFEALDRMKRRTRRELKAEDVASSDLVSVQVDDKVHTAKALMMSAGYSQLPVFDGDAPVGSISERSLFELSGKEKTMEELGDLTVSAVMGESFPVVADSTGIAAVAALMNDCNAVLVSKKGKVVGMITNADMLKLI